MTDSLTRMLDQAKPCPTCKQKPGYYDGLHGNGDCELCQHWTNLSPEEWELNVKWSKRIATGPSREWLEHIGASEDEVGSVSVGGMAVDLGEKLGED